MKPVIDYAIYLVTDRHCLGGRDFYTCLEAALKGGVTLVQLREKDAAFEEFVAVGKKVQDLCRKYQVPLIINDNIEVAKALGAEGVHLGQEDNKLEMARRILGNDAIIGISTHNVEEAKMAEAAGADYLGVGALYSTGSKADAKNVGLETLRQVRAAVQLPLVGIGGITAATYPTVRATGAEGCAMISGILGADDIEATVRGLKG